MKHCSSIQNGGRRPFPLPDGKTYHVFISYATMEPDRQIAHALFAKLSESNFTCCLHEIEFQAGHLIEDNIKTYMKKSLKTIVLLSENFKNSYWCHIEMTEIVQLHMDNKGFPPIVLKLDSCEVPEALKPYTYMLLQAGLDKKMPEIVDVINEMEVTEFPGSMLTISFVPLPCINYNQDTPHSPCIWPHVCAKFILSDDGCKDTCTKHHVLNQESLEKLKKCGFPVEKQYSRLSKLYKEKCSKWLKDFPSKTISGPCYYYNDEGCFVADDACPFPHICKDWFAGKCARSSCKFSHDILNQQTKLLLQKFGFNIDHPDDIILWQYREKCQNYLELKTKQNISFNVNSRSSGDDSKTTAGKCVLYLAFAAMSLNCLFNIFNKYVLTYF
ncbi:uncharacterized protein LOC143054541 [Mytilus galloprovincialis]|uniref:uncharacterized protein LOC143054541 n=1 Tax=Mytilus galloprovincialis TaxID=29158 RepID=UPI003F7C9BE7